MIVFDASALVGAALRVSGVPEAALAHAVSHDRVALSPAVDLEIATVLNRPKFAAMLSAGRRAHILTVLRKGAVWFEPQVRVTDCRDAKDNMYLELALASGAHTIVASDADLLVLDPWRGVRILTPRAYLDRVGAA